MEDIKKIIKILNESETKCALEETDGEWFNNAANEMAFRIKNGEYPVDVINDIARRYSKMKSGCYRDFQMARDILDRRAWEMGLRYTNNDNTMYTKQDFHNCRITDKVTENVRIDEGIIDSFFQRVFSKFFPKISAEVLNHIEIKNIFKDLKYAYFIRNPEYIGKGITKKPNRTWRKIIEFFVKDLEFSEEFLNEVIKHYLGKLDRKNFEKKLDVQLDNKTIEEFLYIMAILILSEGGFENVKTGVYVKDSDQERAKRLERVFYGEKDKKNGKVSKLENIKSKEEAIDKINKILNAIKIEDKDKRDIFVIFNKGLESFFK